MRTFRALVVVLLALGALVVLQPAAGAAVPGQSKTCRSLSSLDTKLHAALESGNSGKVDTSAIGSLASSLRKDEKSSPKSIRSAMGTMADVAANVAHTSSPAAAALALKQGGQKLAAALVKWGSYVGTHCSTSTPSTT